MEKRIYPRVTKRFSAVVKNMAGTHFNVTAVDASSEGLCIQCNTVVRNLITPGGCFVSEGKPVELFVLLELPFDLGQAEKIEVHCHVAFSRRISHDQCKIGMRYTDFDEGGYDLLVKYIKSVGASNDS